MLSWRKIFFRSLRDVFVILLFLAFMFVWNTWLSGMPPAETGTTNHPAAPLPQAGDSLRVMAINIAKGFFYIKGKAHLEPPNEVTERLDQTAAIINAQGADIVFLNEVIWQLPNYQQQVTYLAEKTGMHVWAFGETMNFGLPFWRIQSGNAILSRFPLNNIENVKLRDLDFLELGSARRTLFAQLSTGLGDIQLASIHNDHHDWQVNEQQIDTLLPRFAKQASLIGGDFNVPPESPSMQKVKSSGLFSGEFNGPATSPIWDDPSITIDFVFAPKSWTLLDHQVIDNPASDHKAVLSVFRLPHATVAKASCVLTDVMHHPYF